MMIKVLQVWWILLRLLLCCGVVVGDEDHNNHNNNHEGIVLSSETSAAERNHRVMKHDLPFDWNSEEEDNEDSTFQLLQQQYRNHYTLVGLLSNDDNSDHNGKTLKLSSYEQFDQKSPSSFQPPLWYVMMTTMIEEEKPVTSTASKDDTALIRSSPDTGTKTNNILNVQTERYYYNDKTGPTLINERNTLIPNDADENDNKKEEADCTNDNDTLMDVLLDKTLGSTTEDEDGDPMLLLEHIPKKQRIPKNLVSSSSNTVLAPFFDSSSEALRQRSGKSRRRHRRQRQLQGRRQRNLNSEPLNGTTCPSSNDMQFDFALVTGTTGADTLSWTLVNVMEDYTVAGVSKGTYLQANSKYDHSVCLSWTTNDCYEFTIEQEAHGEDDYGEEEESDYVYQLTLDGVVTLKGDGTHLSRHPQRTSTTYLGPGCPLSFTPSPIPALSPSSLAAAMEENLSSTVTSQEDEGVQEDDPVPSSTPFPYDILPSSEPSPFLLAILNDNLSRAHYNVVESPSLAPSSNPSLSPSWRPSVSPSSRVPSVSPSSRLPSVFPSSQLPSVPPSFWLPSVSPSMLLWPTSVPTRIPTTVAAPHSTSDNIPTSTSEPTSSLLVVMNENLSRSHYNIEPISTLSPMPSVSPSSMLSPTLSLSMAEPSPTPTTLLPTASSWSDDGSSSLHVGPTPSLPPLSLSLIPSSVGDNADIQRGHKEEVVVVLPRMALWIRSTEELLLFENDDVVTHVLEKHFKKTFRNVFDDGGGFDSCALQVEESLSFVDAQEHGRRHLVSQVPHQVQQQSLSLVNYADSPLLSSSSNDSHLSYNTFVVLEGNVTLHEEYYHNTSLLSLLLTEVNGLTPTYENITNSNSTEDTLLSTNNHEEGSLSGDNSFGQLERAVSLVVAHSFFGGDATETDEKLTKALNREWNKRRDVDENEEDTEDVIVSVEAYVGEDDIHDPFSLFLAKSVSNHASGQEDEDSSSSADTIKEQDDVPLSVEEDEESSSSPNIGSTTAPNDETNVVESSNQENDFNNSERSSSDENDGAGGSSFLRGLFDTQVGLGLGIGIGVTIALLMILLIAVASLIAWRHSRERRQRRHSRRLDATLRRRVRMSKAAQTQRFDDFQISEIDVVHHDDGRRRLEEIDTGAIKAHHGVRGLSMMKNEMERRRPTSRTNATTVVTTGLQQEDLSLRSLHFRNVPPKYDDEELSLSKMSFLMNTGWNDGMGTTMSVGTTPGRSRRNVYSADDDDDDDPFGPDLEDPMRHPYYSAAAAASRSRRDDTRNITAVNSNGRGRGADDDVSWTSSNNSTTRDDFSLSRHCSPASVVVSLEDDDQQGHNNDGGHCTRNHKLPFAHSSGSSGSRNTLKNAPTTTAAASKAGPMTRNSRVATTVTPTHNDSSLWHAHPPPPSSSKKPPANKKRTFTAASNQKANRALGPIPTTVTPTASGAPSHSSSLSIVSLSHSTVTSMADMSVITMKSSSSSSSSSNDVPTGTGMSSSYKDDDDEVEEERSIAAASEASYLRLEQLKQTTNLLPSNLLIHQLMKHENEQNDTDDHDDDEVLASLRGSIDKHNDDCCSPARVTTTPTRTRGLGNLTVPHTNRTTSSDDAIVMAAMLAEADRGDEDNESSSLHSAEF